MHTIPQYQEYFSEYLKEQLQIGEPKNLYEPIHYIMSLPGKKLRPVFTLMVAEIFDKDYKEALPAAMAIEMFHNFSLVHDDIMDKAPLRRGKITVHEKWNVNTGILSGDAMLVLSYKFLEMYDADVFKYLTILFSKTALEVCEGQQWDMDFETMKCVNTEQYLKMIEYKTAVLIAAAMKMGAIVAQTSLHNSELIYSFGRNIGIAFQLQDDYLDAFGDEKTFGKQIGGDIIENKKTYLYIKAIELSSAKDAQRLLHLFSEIADDNAKKIQEAKEIFVNSGADIAMKDIIQEYTQKAFDVLDKIEITTEKKQALRLFGENLMRRVV